MDKPYKVVKVGYGPNLEKNKYSSTKKTRYVDVIDRNTGHHYIYPSYLSLGYGFGKMSDTLVAVYNASCQSEDEDADEDFLTVDDFFTYDD